MNIVVLVALLGSVQAMKLKHSCDLDSLKEDWPLCLSAKDLKDLSLAQVGEEEDSGDDKDKDDNKDSDSDDDKSFIDKMKDGVEGGLDKMKDFFKDGKEPETIHEFFDTIFTKKEEGSFFWQFNKFYVNKFADDQGIDNKTLEGFDFNKAKESCDDVTKWKADAQTALTMFDESLMTDEMWKETCNNMAFTVEQFVTLRKESK